MNHSTKQQKIQDRERSEFAEGNTAVIVNVIIDLYFEIVFAIDSIRKRMVFGRYGPNILKKLNRIAESARQILPPSQIFYLTNCSNTRIINSVEILNIE